MLVGPGLVLFGYTHLIRPYWYNGTASYFFLILASATSILGLILVAKLYVHWALHFKIVGIIFYAIALAFYIPFAALFSVCSTGDCI